MSYTTHNFLPGHKLTAGDLNEMDAQIARSEERLDGHQATLDALPATLRRRLSRLSLETDQEHAYLFDGETQLSEIALPSVLSGLVPCTAFSVVTQGPLTGAVGGGTLSIETARQPNDCNQPVLFASENPAVFTVSGAGVVTPVAAGVANVLMRCGAFRSSLAVKIGQRLQPTADKYHLTGRAMWYADSRDMTVETAGTDGRGYVTLFTDADLQIPDGYTVRVALGSERLQLRTLTYLLPGGSAFSYNGGGIARLGVEWTRLNDCAAVVDPKSIGEAVEGEPKYYGSFSRGEGSSWTNDAGETAWAVISLSLYDEDGNGGYTEREATAADIPFVMQNLVITLTPGE